MARFHWLLLSCLSMFLFCSPAEAGKLLFWRFESDQNRLVFTTDAGVQPRAQLIFNPTRLVIDLPGTVLGKPTDKQAFGGKIRSVRVGQFDPQTTRIVVELEPGYTIDPQQVEFRGISPTQWTVNLPSPQAADTPPPPASESDTPTLEESSAPPSPSAAAESASSSEAVQVTRNGLLIQLDGSSENEIEVSRSRDRRSIDVEIPGITLPAHLESQALAVNSYGVSEIEFEQTSNSPPVAHLTLNVTEASPDWQATFSRLGGLVLFPQGGVSAIASSSTTTVSSSRSLSRREATVVAAELADDDTRLLIRGNGGKLNASGDWNSVTGVYKITIPNAKLDQSFEGPELQATSPIAKLRVRQENDETVVFSVEPASGVQVDGVAQQGDNLGVQLRLPRAAAAAPATVFVPPPESTPPPPTTPPPQAAPPPASAAVPQGQILVTIDPGHGGKDPGTIGINGVQEKNVVLPISLQVKQYLEQQGVRVQITRDSDYFVSLEGRSQMANRADADLFVSIHANAINLSRPDVNGLEVYYFQSGQRLAQTIHRSILQSVSIRDRRVRQARFYVLRKSSMPAVLVETGFLTGQEDAANLTQESYRRQMAEAIARGILDYIRQNSL